MVARCSRWARKGRWCVSLNTTRVVQGTTQDFVIVCSFEEVFFCDSFVFGSELNHARKVFLIVLIIIKKQGLASFLVLHGDNLALAWLLSPSDWSVFKAEVMAGLLANIPFSSTRCTMFPRHLGAFWLFSGKKKKKRGGKGPRWAWKPSCSLVESRLFTVVLGAGAVSRAARLGLAAFSMAPRHHGGSCCVRGDRAPQPHINRGHRPVAERWFSHLC